MAAVSPQTSLGVLRASGWVTLSPVGMIQLTSTRKVGTRFVASTEAGATKIHKDGLVSAGFDDTTRTVIFTGRPVRVRRTDYIENWYESWALVSPLLTPNRNNNRQDEIKELTSKGIIPVDRDLEKV